MFIESTTNKPVAVPKEYTIGKRHLTVTEITALKSLLNTSEDPSWQNVFVTDGFFDATLVTNTEFSGYVVIGKVRPGKIYFHDLTLRTGIYNTKLHDVVIGDDNAIHNSVIENYMVGDRNIISQVQELLCTHHAKFGNGFTSDGELESSRIRIEIANENGGRAVLPYERLTVGDAFLWSKYRGDQILMQKFQDFVLNKFSPAKNTMGTIGSDCTIKNTTLVKDAKIGNFCYIKGAFKLKNLTIHSSKDSPTQIGEGVEMVNGIVHSGCRIFYGAIAVRFIMMENCQLKYGARLLNSVLGENSTVSCCELLNNLIFPFHEQHHNSSFLIASTVMGQSNIAAGATIGSNHNSRGNNGELIAGRGFWPGLCTSFKHNSRFASFVLVQKGTYQKELNIEYPFSLVATEDKDSKKADSEVSGAVFITPAWYLMSDMYAVIRNKYKFRQRDGRSNKQFFIETDPFAPDTMAEIVDAIPKLQKLLVDGEKTSGGIWDTHAQKKFGAVILKSKEAITAYQGALIYYVANSLVDYCASHGVSTITAQLILQLCEVPLCKRWRNIGGQLISLQDLELLFQKVKDGEVNSWEEVHTFYIDVQNSYIDKKARYALFLLGEVYGDGGVDGSGMSDDAIRKIRRCFSDAATVASAFCIAAERSFDKDFVDKYRAMVYDNECEMDAVLGKKDDCPTLVQFKHDVDTLKDNMNKLLPPL